MIEQAPKEYEAELTWNEAIFYCFSLNIEGDVGWRLPTYDEIRIIVGYTNTWKYWYGEVRDDSETKKYRVIPVRDLKDD